MSRKIWLSLAVAALLALSCAATVLAARGADHRSSFVTRGLDYLHARQGDDAGFGTAANTAWAVLGAVASGERMGSSAWTVKGKNPFDYLQGVNHDTAASSAVADNAPIYYARMIMAYVAVGKRDRVFVAGTPHVDLLAKLYTYQDMTDGSSTKGSFSPSSSTRTFDAVHTTAWAVLSMYNFGVTIDDRFTLARTWLAGEQLAGGGFPAEPGEAADVTDTALAIQALTARADAPGWDVTAARQFLKDNQNADGGFPASPGGRTNAEATSAAIQAIVALGESPLDDFWKVGVNTPIHALGTLQKTNGSYKLTSRLDQRNLPVTGWALVAMRRRSFSSFPKEIGSAEKAFVYRPEVLTLAPKAGAKYTTTRIVLIRATYTDHYPKGTGVKPADCRLYVDNVDQSKHADIGRYGLHLQLKNVPNGEHTFRIEVRDYAGNAKVVERKFTVAVPTPTPTWKPTYQPTYTPTYYPTITPTHTTTPTSYPTATPTETLSPYPYPTDSSSAAASPIVTGSPLPSPSTSASPAGGEGGNGSAAGYVGGTLLAMLPIGAVVSYLILHRREELLGAASQGTVLAGGGSAWQRLKHTLARSRDLTRPSPRE